MHLQEGLRKKYRPFDAKHLQEEINAIQIDRENDLDDKSLSCSSIEQGGMNVHLT